MRAHVCAFVQLSSVDAGRFAKLPLSAVTPVPDPSEGHGALKVRLSDSINILERDKS